MPPFDSIGLELPLRPGGLEGHGEAAPLAGRAHRGGGFAPLEGHHGVSGLDRQLELVEERPALCGHGQSRQCALAHDHGVNELDRHVARIRAGLGRDAEGDQPPAPGEALSHPVAELRQPPRLGPEVPPVGISPGVDQRVNARRSGRHGLCHAGAAARSAAWTSQLRRPSTPSPVRALTSMISASGFTERML